MKSLIFGLSGLTLSEEEREFFLANEPHGFILFSRNCETREQIIAVTSGLRSLFPGRKDLRIFIDQEGGRVTRIKPPIINKLYPAAKTFDEIENSKIAYLSVLQNYHELMEELMSLGIDSTCAPVVDLFFEGSDDIVGDRSFGSDPVKVSNLAKAALRGIEEVGGHGVIKHIPGHGRATCDSHLFLPIVRASLEELSATDFEAFRLIPLNSNRYAMTAHIIYEALDPDNPATLSKKVIDYIRTNIKFIGKIMTDDISMKALIGSGNLSQITKKALNAGCDLILHCNGNIDEMREVAYAYDEYMLSLDGDVNV